MGELCEVLSGRGAFKESWGSSTPSRMDAASGQAKNYVRLFLSENSSFF